MPSTRNGGSWSAKGDIDSGIFVKEQGPDGTVKSVEKGVKRSSITLDQFKQVHQELFRTRLELAIAESWLKEVQDSMKVAAEKTPAADADGARLLPEIERRFKQDPQVIELASQMVEAKAKLEEVRKASKEPDDPAVQVARDKLKARSMPAMTSSGRPSSGRSASRSWRASRIRKPSWTRLEARVRALSVRERALQKQFDQLDVKNRRQATDEVDLALIQEQRESLRTMKEVVNRRLEQLSFEARGGDRISIFNKATPPGAPISDPRSPLMSLLPIIMLPLAFAFFLGVEAISGPSSGPAKEDPPAEV